MNLPIIPEMIKRENMIMIVDMNNLRKILIIKHIIKQMIQERNPKMKELIITDIFKLIIRLKIKDLITS